MRLQKPPDLALRSPPPPPLAVDNEARLPWLSRPLGPATDGGASEVTSSEAEDDDEVEATRSGTGGAGCGGPYASGRDPTANVGVLGEGGVRASDGVAGDG
jgi:hypothetical protein